MTGGPTMKHLSIGADMALDDHQKARIPTRSAAGIRMTRHAAARRAGLVTV